MPTLRPKRLGDVPVGLGRHLREYLRSIKDALEILMGALQNQLDSSSAPPGSQAVTFDDVTGDSAATNHASNHENDGVDEIDVMGLSGKLADEQDPLDHASNHENGGPDEVDVTDLSGKLADAQTPLAHVHSHAGLTAKNWAAAGHTMDAALDMNNNKIADLATPTLLNDAVNMEWAMLVAMIMG